MVLARVIIFSATGATSLARVTVVLIWPFSKEDVANKLFKELGPKYAERSGGYTRIIKIGPI